MKFLERLERLVIIAGVGLAVFPLWAWIAETEDRAITRSAMRLAAYEYCFRILTKQQDLVGETLQLADVSPAAVEAAAYADEIAEEECGLFHDLAERRVQTVAPPAQGGRVATSVEWDGAPPETPSPSTEIGPVAAAPPPAATPAEGAMAAPDGERSSSATRTRGGLIDDAPDESASFSSEESMGAALEPAVPDIGLRRQQASTPTGPLMRGDYILLGACDGEAIALSRTRVLCSDGTTRRIDAETLESLDQAQPMKGRAPAFDRIIDYYQQEQAPPAATR